MIKQLIAFSILISCFPFCKESCVKNGQIETASSTYDSITHYFASRQKTALDTSAQYLFVLTENGCMSCNKKFEQFIQKYIPYKNCLFIVGSPGNFIDCSKYPRQKNVFTDQSILETEYALFHHSKVIVLNKKQVDTSITIDAINLETGMDLIEKRLSLSH